MDKLTGTITKVYPFKETPFTGKYGPTTIFKVGFVFQPEEGEAITTTFSAFGKKKFDPIYKIILEGNEVEIEYEQNEGENGKVYINTKMVHFISGKARQDENQGIIVKNIPSKQPFNKEVFIEEFKKTLEEVKDIKIPDGYGGEIFFGTPQEILLLMILKKI